jgi:DNA-directed RNA polymerase subunit RPC12/RpoP
MAKSPRIRRKRKISRRGLAKMMKCELCGVKMVNKREYNLIKMIITEVVRCDHCHREIVTHEKPLESKHFDYVRQKGFGNPNVVFIGVLRE